MTVSLVGTAAAPATVAGHPVTGAWGTGQNRTSGNLLIAAITAASAVSCAASTLSTGSGWSKLIEVGAATPALAAIWTKAATGSDAAPAFDSSLVGAGGEQLMSCALYELTDSGAVLPAIDTDGTAAGTTTNQLAVVTSGNVLQTGELAIGVQSYQEGSTTTPGWSGLAGWTLTPDTANTFNHWIYGTLAGPTPGATLTFNPSKGGASSKIVGAIAVFKGTPATSPFGGWGLPV